MAGSLGREYNTERAYTEGTRPEIIKRAGVIIKVRGKGAKGAKSGRKFKG